VHCHQTEETFFILDGECLVRCWEGEASFDIRLGRWDLVPLPSFLQHEMFNEAAGECPVQTLLPKPHPLRLQNADLALDQTGRFLAASIVEDIALFADAAP
jgi:hypothetical protein